MDALYMSGLNSCNCNENIDGCFIYLLVSFVDLLFLDLQSYIKNLVTHYVIIIISGGGEGRVWSGEGNFRCF